nr:maleylpyruvate isomerase N-terminal domain-containing protein [Arthrobacter sp.]
MPKSSLRRTLWHAVHVERAALAEDLAKLDDDQWAQPSLCGRWTVQDVTAHLTAAASIGPLRWFFQHHRGPLRLRPAQRSPPGRASRHDARRNAHAVPRRHGQFDLALGPFRGLAGRGGGAQ